MSDKPKSHNVIANPDLSGRGNLCLGLLRHFVPRNDRAENYPIFNYLSLITYHAN